jgi:hypothetical protein
MSGEHLYED